MSEGFFRNPSFLDYVRLLYQLHRAIKEGWDETSEGEGLRERIDAPRRGLSREETASLNGISADFYSLTETPIQGGPAITAEAMADLEAALEARKSSDFNTSLALLRKHSDRIPPASLAYLRGRIWLEAGEFPIATDFLQRASELAPENPNFRYIALHSLWKADPDRASSRARAILSQAGQNPAELVLKAADILAHQAQTLPSDQTRRELQSLIPTLQDSIFRLETSGEAEVHPDLLGQAFDLVDVCRRQIG
jgi:tetratricopeptide (TPR) repeat protein